jgi:diguanylate cyclase
MYVPRAAGLALGGVAIAGVLIANGAALWVWGALFATAIVWPHLALWVGSRARNPFRAELRNLMIDSALGGAWIALMQFNLLPSVVVLIMLSMDKMAVGGAWLLARCSTVLLLTCVAMSAVMGFQVRTYTNMVQIIGTLPLLILYPMIVGLTAYRLARRLREQNQLLSEISRTDALSGLLNRRYWEDAVASQFQRCVLTGQPASVLMLDIDHFKSINDRHGHPVGDEVIRNVGAILRASLREEDVPGRYGGEEFGILLPETPAAGAEMIDNAVGTACGFAVDIGKARFFFTPGVPRELRGQLVDALARLAPVAGPGDPAVLDVDPLQERRDHLPELGDHQITVGAHLRERNGPFESDDGFDAQRHALVVLRIGFSLREDTCGSDDRLVRGGVIDEYAVPPVRSRGDCVVPARCRFRPKAFRRRPQGRSSRSPPDLRGRSNGVE